MRPDANNADGRLRLFLFTLGSLLAIVALAASEKRRNRILEEVTEIANKRFRLAYCQYCQQSFRTADELVDHWLEFRGKCNVQNVEKTDSETRPH